MKGEVGILNVGAGDTKLSFDKSNPAECLRAGRIVQDMLRRGYALLVEVTQPDGTKAFQRAHAFDANTAEYIVADFDPSYAQEPAPLRPMPTYVPPPQYGTAEPQQAPEAQSEEASEAPAGSAAESAAEAPAPAAPRRGRPRTTKRVPASSTRAVAVARSAGG